ncbi:CatB-related O-acetyltransferase [Polaribacter gochangensis]|uniref:CatB-related O-acetyltransferase n=1 Tax=Polaribacter gochangensis TaxID=3252903 RepID=UPI003904721B
MIKKNAYKYLLWTKRFIFRTQLKKKRVRISTKSNGYLNVKFEGNNDVPRGCNFSGKITLGKATTLGFNNFLSGNIIIGKYCQLGSDVAMYSSNHPITYLSTYINSKLYNGELKELKENYKIEIGNDVWIGHGVIIVGNIKIGNGAIIAAGAVVTKDVIPYAIVAGTPAKLIKKRFSDLIINEIEELKWWDKNEVELEKLKPLFFKNFKEVKSIYE